jgi:hypothetical protein
MKRLLAIITAGFIISLTSFAQIGVYTATDSPAKENKVMPYDSTKNFLGKSHVKSYEGQILYVNGVSSDLQKYGYQYIYSRKVRGDGCHYGVPYGTFATCSPYDSLVGKYFVVKNVDDEKWYLDEYWFQLENRDDPNDVAWFYYQGEYEHAFPFITLSHFDYLKSRYIGKEIAYFGRSTKDEFIVEFRNCINVGIEDKYYNLSLFFEDGKATNVDYDKEISPLLGYFILKEVYDRLIARYGADMVNVAMRHRVCVGMAEELLLLSWGQPKKINRRSYDDNDQWVYDNSQYVYVRNGIITAWSD